MNILQLFSMVFVCSLWLLPQEKNTCVEGSHTLYSEYAVPLDNGLTRIKSPDGKKLLTVRRVEDQRDPDGVHMSFLVEVGGRRLHTKLLGFNGEVSWSPDSSAFAVTEIEGGGGIGENAYVIYVDENNLKKIDVFRPVVSAFGVPAKCEVPVPPNTAFVGWLNGSANILVVAEIVPVSICPCSGTYELFELALPDLRIIQRYSQIEAKQKFGSLLGCELRDAKDACVDRVHSNRDHIQQKPL
jgi:hypothetical protein